jgi:hypothetical protein
VDDREIMQYEDKPKHHPPSDPIIPQEEVTYTYTGENDADSRGGCRGCSVFLAGMGGCLVVVVLVVFGAVLLGFTSVGALFGGFTSFLSGGPARAEVVSTRTLVTSLQPLGLLVTVRSDMVVEDIQVGMQQNVGNACGVSANHIASGGVEAGIDLTQIDEGNVTYDTVRNVYTLTLPAPGLTTCRVDNIEQHSRSFTFCPVNWDTARLLANYVALTKFRDDAIEGGILDRAAVEGQLVLSNFLAQATDANIEIVFQQPETPTLAASCQPEPPDGWRIDPNTGGWTR